jgi:hypothetical protein
VTYTAGDGLVVITRHCRGWTKIQDAYACERLLIPCFLALSTIALLLTLPRAAHGSDSSSSPDFKAATDAIADLSRACEHDDGALWRISLCGPMILVAPDGRHALLTHSDPQHQFEQRASFFFGSLPEDILAANTSVHWGNQDWAMVMLPLPENRFDRIKLLAHESFHRVQMAWHLPGDDPMNEQLDTEAGRLWLRLELRALAKSLRSSGSTARQSAADAMLFRAYRDSLFADAARRESALEMREGLAEYTGSVIALHETGEVVDRVARQVESAEDQTSLARSFAYATGPALGILLDRYSAGWRQRIMQTGSLAKLLTGAVGELPPEEKWASESQQRAVAYGYQAVATEEREQEARREAQLRLFKERFIDGPVLRFPTESEMQREFDPHILLAFPPYGTVYPTGTFSANWGKLQVEDIGALVAPDNQSLRIVAPADIQARPLHGPGWQLELKPGWSVRPGSRPGDFVVVEPKE